MKAARVHGASEVLARISLRFGLRGQYGPCTAFDFGIATDSGLVDSKSSCDIDFVSSMSASQPELAERTEGGVRVDFPESEEDIE